MPMPRRAKTLFALQLAILAALLALIPIERSLPPFEEIRLAGSAWNVDLTADPRYAERSLLMGINLVGVGVALIAALALWGMAFRQRISMDLPLLSGSVMLLLLVRGILLAPYWINGVTATVAPGAQVDMDPQALIPALWLPLWGFVAAGTLVLVITATVTLALITALWVMLTRRWHLLLLVPTPLVIAWLLGQLAPSWGQWLMD